MYQDQDSIKVFQRLHARDRIAESAHHLDHSSGDGYDLFASHARAEVNDGRVGIVLSVAVLAALAGIAALFWD